MTKFYDSRIAMLTLISGGFLVFGCEKLPPTLDSNSSVNNQSGPSKALPSALDNNLAKRKADFAQMQESVQGVAAIKSSKKGPEFDYKFELPSNNWVKLSHGGGDRKSSVWLYQLKDSGIKVLLSCGGTKEAPEFKKSAQMVYDSAKKKDASVAREWNVGNFVLRRSFIGIIDDRHGEATVTAFSPACALEFNIASETEDRDELVKLADKTVEDFIKMNPTGGFPSH
jgi:hypothetical protein